MDNKPISEQFRLAAEDWAKFDAAARMREEGKTTFLSSLKTKVIGDDPKMSEAKAERLVKSGEEWWSYIAQMVSDRNEANKRKINMDYLRMRHSEEMSFDASKRAEMRL